MKNTVLAILAFVVFFSLGYLYSSKSMLFTEFVESNSNALSRTFLERSSVYLMLRQEQKEKAEKVVEALIFSDLVAMKVIDFSDTNNADIFCSRLAQLNDSVEDDVIFVEDLKGLMKKCP